MTAITVHPLSPDFVAEVGDVDLSRPLAPADLDAIKQAFWNSRARIGFADWVEAERENLETVPQEYQAKMCADLESRQQDG